MLSAPSSASGSRNFELDIVLPGWVWDLRQLSRARALQRFGAQRSLSGYEDEMPKNQPHRRFSILVSVHTGTLIVSSEL